VAGLEKSAWLNLEHIEAPDPQETITEEFVERLKRYVNDSFARYVSRVIEIDRDSGRVYSLYPNSYSVEEKIRILLEKDLLPGIRLLKNDEAVITSSLLRELDLEGKVNLKSLAELLGWEYRVVKVGGRPVKAAVTRLQNIVDLLVSSADLQQQQQQQQGQQSAA
ncbi:MAG: hypothetical protein QXK25_06630, partial [Ignisphaera sp.]